VEQHAAEEDSIHYSIAGSPVPITCNDDTGDVRGRRLPWMWGWLTLSRT
jgi:hypothetical protein